MMEVWLRKSLNAPRKSSIAVAFKRLCPLAETHLMIITILRLLISSSPAVLKWLAVCTGITDYKNLI